MVLAVETGQHCCIYIAVNCRVVYRHNVWVRHCEAAVRDTAMTANTLLESIYMCDHKSSIATKAGRGYVQCGVRTKGHWMKDYQKCHPRTKGHLFTKTYLTKLYNRFVVQFLVELIYV